MRLNGTSWCGMSLMIVLAALAGPGCRGVTPPAGATPRQQPKLVRMGVESLPTADDDAPLIEQFEVRASRNKSDPRTLYSMSIQGTLARPEGLDAAYGPTGWAVLEVLDAQGRSMRFTTESYVEPAELQSQPVAELYRRIGSTMGRMSDERLPFAIHLRDLDYLTPELRRLTMRSYALIAENEQTVDLPLPEARESATVGEMWTLSVEETASEKQELVLHAIAAEPTVWPLQVELRDAQGKLLSVGFRRGLEKRGDTPLVRWQFNQAELVADAPRTLRIRLATGLSVKQLDAELADVTLVELGGE